MSEKSKKSKGKTVTSEDKPVLTQEEKIKADVKAAIAAVEAKYEFLTDKAEEYGKVAVGDLTVLEGFDSRAAPGATDGAFLDSLKNPDGTPHLIEPVVAAWVKDKATGKVGRLMVAGRRRLAGFVQLGFTVIDCVTRGMTLQNALVDTGTENMKRAGLGAWDKAIFFERLVAAGLSQKEIAVKYGVSNSNVSQTLSILGLDERVRNIAKAGKFGPGGDTICRELAKIKDPDMQAAVAAEVIADSEHIWAASDVERYVKKLNDDADKRAQRKAEKEKEKKRKAKEAKAAGRDPEAETEEEEEEEEEDPCAYDIEEFTLREIKPIHQLMEKTVADMERFSTKHDTLKADVAAVKAKYAHVLKYVELQGELKALEMVVGVKDLPVAVLKAVEVEAAA